MVISNRKGWNLSYDAAPENHYIFELPHQGWSRSARKLRPGCLSCMTGTVQGRRGLVGKVGSKQSHLFQKKFAQMQMGMNLKGLIVSTYSIWSRRGVVLHVEPVEVFCTEVSLDVHGLCVSAPSSWMWLVTPVFHLEVDVLKDLALLWQRHKEKMCLVHSCSTTTATEKVIGRTPSQATHEDSQLDLSENRGPLNQSVNHHRPLSKNYPCGEYVQHAQL